MNIEIKEYGQWNKATLFDYVDEAIRDIWTNGQIESVEAEVKNLRKSFARLIVSLVESNRLLPEQIPGIVGTCDVIREGANND